jgi:hypothetical protein
VVRSRARHAFVAAVIGSILVGSLDSPSQVSSAEAERFSIVIRGRSVDGPQRTIRATQGTMLELAFAADETVELHLHGFCACRCKRGCGDASEALCGRASRLSY